HNTTNDFIDFYQSLDVLIVDDIQEWMDAPKTLDTFFYISNQLKSSGKQVILASDQPPVKLKGMKKDLIARLASGLVVEIEAPNEQLSIEILRANCIQSGLDVNDEVIEYIAKNVKGSVCNLEGIVNSLKAHSTINTAINMQLAERLIKHLFN
ncbi:MAG: chromosomal replication initiator protein DnaA, partial [Prevotella sp.]|nr:chromosomal replication initiator protein DnaA [Prevotella sp.]